jgi:copper homeostasis protein
MKADPFEDIYHRLEIGGATAMQPSTGSAQNTDIVFELCAEDLDACRAAAPGGAHRIELCTTLEVGGLTPPDALIAAAVEQSRLPVHVLLRPTAESFEYSPSILRSIVDSMARARRLGAAGFVAGTLNHGRVDRAHTRALVDAAEGLPVTFHRAFDDVQDKDEALEDLIEAGCARVLTSAGAPNVLSGAKGLAALSRQAAGRIAVAAGGGLRIGNATEVARLSGLRHFHASLRDPETAHGERPLTLEQRIARLLAALRRAPAPPHSGGWYGEGSTGSASVDRGFHPKPR